MPTLPDFQTQINALVVRLNLLDGTGLLPPAQGFTAQTNASLAGMKSDITQAVLSLEGSVNALTATVQVYVSQLEVLLGLAGVTYTPPTMVPPTT
jgi:hypothetical protein